MANVYPTLLDIAKLNGSDALAGLIDECLTAVPELNIGYARSIKGINYKVAVRTALPTVGFRAANEGIENTVATRINRLVEAYILDASWSADQAVADSYEDGAAAYCTLEAGDHMQAALRHICSQFYYGTAADAKGFPGLVSQVNSDMEVDATGADSDTSSVWGVKYGPQNVAWVLGQNGQVSEGETKNYEQTRSSKTLWVYGQSITARVGLQIGNQYSIGRIKNIDSGKPCTDDLISDLLKKFMDKDLRPDYLLMSPRSLQELQDSRTATNPTGAPAPFPTQSFNVPIVVSTSITDTETAS